MHSHPSCLDATQTHFGPPSAGKSMFLQSAVSHLDLDIPSVALQPLTQNSEAFLTATQSHVAKGTTPDKTRMDVKQQVVSMLASTPREDIELHFMDATGEQFESLERAADLTYMDYIRTLILIVAPLPGRAR